MDILAVTELSELSVLLGAVFAAFGAILVGFYKYAQARETDFEKAKDNQTAAFNTALDKLGDHLDSNTQAVQNLAVETADMRKIHEKGYKEAEQRNGHLAEISVQARDDIIKVINSVNKQEVKLQTVENQTVNNKE